MGTPTTGTSGKATASLIMGILGLIICPLICSILAIVFANQAKADIAANPALGGAGLAQAGKVLGIIGLVLAALGAVLWIILLAAA